MQAIKDDNLKKLVSCLAGCVHRQPRLTLRGGVSRGGESSGLHHLSMKLHPLDQVSRAALGSGW